MRIHFYWALLGAVLLFLQYGCASTYTGCNEAYFENLPGCPAEEVYGD